MQESWQLRNSCQLFYAELVGDCMYPKRLIFFLSVLCFAFFSNAQIAASSKIVHLEKAKSGLDLYLTIPDSSSVEVFRVSSGKIFHAPTDVVAIHLDSTSLLGDVFMEPFENTLEELKEIRNHGKLANMFVQYYRETENDLILEYKDPQTSELFYEFHYVKEVDGRQYYFCSDVINRYDLVSVLAMHKIAESLRTEP